MSKQKSESKGSTPPPPLRQIHKIICFLRRGHRYFEEIIIDDNHTVNYCKCGAKMGFDWSAMGGYKHSMSIVSDLVKQSERD